MLGITSSGKEEIGKIVDDIFDTIAIQFIGNIPSLRHKKLLILNTQPNYGLANLFVQAMGNKEPNYVEADVLKGLLSSAHGYIDSLKNRTRSSVTERIDSVIKEANYKKAVVTKAMIEDVIQDEMERAKSQLALTFEAETTKIRNMGSAMEITRTAVVQSDYDPYVVFIVVRATACTECVRLHLMPDGITPRVWKLSELKQGWHKRGEDMPSVSGLHPHCLCTLSYMTKGYGYTAQGKLTYISSGYDAYTDQRSK